MGAFDDLIPGNSGGPFDDLIPPEGGFKASSKQTIGQTIKGAGQAAADFIPGVSSDNALSRYGQSVVDANPTAVHGLSDLADKPVTGVKETLGNALAGMGGMVGARLLGQGITAAAPLTGPFAPATVALGQGISWAGPALMAALPSFSGIRDTQKEMNPAEADSLKSKAMALGGAGLVGAIETGFGPQEWALKALSKEGRDALAKQFASKSLKGAIAKGAIKGGAIEGSEELVQNPIEQLAGYQDPTTKESLSDTAFSGLMGAIGGGVLGGAGGGAVHLGSPATQQPTVDPNTGPLGRAAATAQATGAAAEQERISALRAAADMAAKGKTEGLSKENPDLPPFEAFRPNQPAFDMPLPPNQGSGEAGSGTLQVDSSPRPPALRSAPLEGELLDAQDTIGNRPALEGGIIDGQAREVQALPRPALPAPRRELPTSNVEAAQARADQRTQETGVKYAVVPTGKQIGGKPLFVVQPEQSNDAAQVDESGNQGQGNVPGGSGGDVQARAGIRGGGGNDAGESLGGVRATEPVGDVGTRDGAVDATQAQGARAAGVEAKRSLPRAAGKTSTQQSAVGQDETAQGTDVHGAASLPDVSGKTQDQLAYLSTNGKPGWKEAAQAEIARRSLSSKGSPIVNQVVKDSSTTQPGQISAQETAKTGASAGVSADISADKTAEQKIRDAWKAKTGTTIGSWHPLTVEHNGVSQNFMANQKRVSNGRKDAAIHLVSIRNGRLMASDPARPLAYYYKLDGNNNLAEEGIPSIPTELQLKKWRSSGFAVPGEQDTQTPADAAQPPAETVKQGQEAPAASSAPAPVTQQQTQDAPGRVAPTRSDVDAETMETRTNVPQVAQPTPTKTVTVASRTLSGPKNVRAKLYELPGYNGPQLAIVKYGSGRGQGYRVYLPKTGAMVADNNGVMDLNETLKLAVLRVQNARKTIAKRESAQVQPTVGSPNAPTGAAQGQAQAGEKDAAEEIFIRKATKRERTGGKPNHDAMRALPEKDGYEVVFKPYGKDGEGFYYKKRNVDRKAAGESLKGAAQGVVRDQPTHSEPGQSPEAATVPVIGKALQKSSRNTPLNIKEAKAWLLSEIDRAVSNVPPENNDMAAELAQEKTRKFKLSDRVEKLGKGVMRYRLEKSEREQFDAMKSDRIAKTAMQIGFVTFDVPGDGKFRVVNTVDAIAAFRAKVEASPGFREQHSRSVQAQRSTASQGELRRMTKGPLADKSATLEDLANAIEIARANGIDDIQGVLDRFEEVANMDYDTWRGEQDANDLDQGEPTPSVAPKNSPQQSKETPVPLPSEPQRAKETAKTDTRSGGNEQKTPDSVSTGAQKGGAKFSRNATATPIDSASLKQTVASLRKAYPQATIREHESDQSPTVPKALRDDIANSGAQGDVAGAYKDGVVHVFRSGIRDQAHAEKTIFHELTHRGLARMFGLGIKQPMLGIYASNADIATEADRIAKQYGYDRATAVEEALADLGGDMVSVKGFDKLVAYVRAALRKLGLVSEWSNNDVALLVQRAREKNKGGFTASAMFSRGSVDGMDDANNVASEQAPNPAGGDTTGGAKKPNERQAKAWELGLKHRKELDGEAPGVFFYEAMPDAELRFVSDIEANYPVSNAFYKSALRGAEMPKRATGWRYGDAPKSGYSRDHVNDRSEVGVSMAEVDGVKYTWYPMQAVKGAVHYEGWLLDPDNFWGSDGEPLMVGLTKIKSNEPSASAGSGAKFSRSAQAFSRATDSAAFQKSGEILSDLFTTHSTFGALKGLKTQYHKATLNPMFKAFWERANAMAMDSARSMSRPADLASRILPKFDPRNMGDAAKALFAGRSDVLPGDLKAVAKALSDGTLDGGPSPLSGRLWTREDLITPKGQYVPGSGSEGTPRMGMGLTEKQADLYEEARSAVDASLDELAAATSWKLASQHLNPALRQWISEDPQAAPALLNDAMETRIADAKQALKELDGKELESAQKALDAMQEDAKAINEIFDKAEALKQAGYMPLMRFGKYRVAVTMKENGKETATYVGRYESHFEANQARRELEKQFSGKEFTVGPVTIENENAWKMFKGVNPETVMLFAEEAGIKADDIMQQWYREAVSSRSALKRMIERTGVAGYSEDLPRVLASFITSNGKQAGYAYHLGDMQEMLQNKDMPGDVQEEAQSLLETIQEPNERGAKMRGLMATWYLLGSIGSALVNSTQTVTMSVPWLSQFGAKGFSATEAASAMGKAYKMVLKPITMPADLKAAMKRAEQNGIVDSNEVFHLYAESMKPMISKLGSGNLAYRARAFMTLWGAPFAMVETLNRRATFAAAYSMAKAQGKSEGDAAKFAERAVIETQSIFAKHNRPNWSRGAIGAAALTFKQFSVAYVEMLARMIRKGPDGNRDPAGVRAAMLTLGILMALSGASGLPGEDDLLDAIDTFAQIFFDKPTLSRMEIRNFLHDNLGKELGGFVNSGVSNFLPVDVSSRLGLGNLIPGTGLFKPSEKDKTGELLEIFAGVQGGFVQSMVDSVRMISEGNVSGAIKSAAPKAIQDVAKGVEMLATGEARDRAGRKVVDASPADSIWQMIGLNPNVKAEAGKKAWDVTEYMGYVKNAESNIVGRWARGIVDGDMEAIGEAQKELAEWNLSNPDAPIGISRTQIAQRVHALRMERAGRIEKTAPREMRSRVRELMEED